MTIENKLEEILKNLEPQCKTGKVIVETQQVAEVSTYLVAEKIYHCSLSKHNIVVIGFANYAEMQKIDSQYPVHITGELHYTGGHDTLQKLDPNFHFEPSASTQLFSGSVPVHNVYDVKEEQVSGFIRHSAQFDVKKYGVNICTTNISTFRNITFGHLFDIVLDKEVVYIEKSRRLHLC